MLPVMNQSEVGTTANEWRFGDLQTQLHNILSVFSNGLAQKPRLGLGQAQALK